jgi:quercetin dioxygenase-like cupin family protein
LIGRATFGESFSIKRMGPDGWDVKVKATPALDVAVQRIVFQPGSQSGWHSHPGPVFISVVEGTMTFYESDDPTCTPVVRHAGEGFLDVGDHAHIARNETSEPATNVVTYLVPPGAAVRIDEPNPGNCPF